MSSSDVVEELQNSVSPTKQAPEKIVEAVSESPKKRKLDEGDVSTEGVDVESKKARQEEPIGNAEETTEKVDAPESATESKEDNESHNVTVEGLNLDPRRERLANLLKEALKASKVLPEGRCPDDSGTAIEAAIFSASGRNTEDKKYLTLGLSTVKNIQGGCDVYTAAVTEPTIGSTFDFIGTLSDEDKAEVDADVNKSLASSQEATEENTDTA